MNSWLVEERNQFGRWSSVIYQGDKPSPKTTGCPNKVFRNDPVPVPEFLIGRDIRKVTAVLSPDGEFYGIDFEAIVAFYKEGISDRFMQSINGGRG